MVIYPCIRFDSTVLHSLASGGVFVARILYRIIGRFPWRVDRDNKPHVLTTGLFTPTQPPDKMTPMYDEMFMNLALALAQEPVPGPPQVDPAPQGSQWGAYASAIILIIGVTLASTLDPKRRPRG